ncbi:hypothetical protein GCM10023088_46640 [Actinomadura verrucosospora]
MPENSTGDAELLASSPFDNDLATALLTQPSQLTELVAPLLTQVVTVRCE